MFRETSQRILLRSITLHSNLKEAHTFLKESPHVASYITVLSLWLAWNRPASYIASLQQILQVATLVNVRKCVLADMGDIFRASYHTPASTLLDFLAHQPLRELHLSKATAVPPAVILRLLSTAPHVSFISVSVEKDSRTSLDTFRSPPNAPKVEGLDVRHDAEDVYELLALPQFKSCISALRRLFVNSMHVYSMDDPRSYVQLPPLSMPILSPAFPLLRSAEFSVFMDRQPAPWLDFVLATVCTSPLLSDITISFIPRSETDWKDIHTHVLDGALLASLDAELAAHHARPVIRWRLDFLDNSDSADIFTDFTTAAETAMPKMCEEKRLLLEMYDQSAERWG
ncbi:hypothetical protein MVEN_01472100 [Mycena venus]|uniref:Uncharacterized protein n=1 Tax=Mycena venus TaxID=2733690 RepID=A0A8H6XSB9_9AGAR|nr:hypothetical protein MVEN_01472100 [Mycena venus]